MKEILPLKSIISRYKLISLAILLVQTNLIIVIPTKCQEIPFGSFSSKYSVTMTELTAQDLNFGTVLVGDSSPPTVDLLNSKILSIEGVKYLDISVIITPDEDLLLNGSCAVLDDTCRIGLNLRAAYANRGTNDTNDAIELNPGAILTARFPIFSTGIGPPGPPPTPVYEGYNPALFYETAYLYLFGTLDAPTNAGLQAGIYLGNVNVMVNYE